MKWGKNLEKHLNKFDAAPETESVSPVVNYQKQKRFRGILKHMLPFLTGDETDVILSEILITLKLEGIIGKKVSLQEAKMISMIKESVLLNKDKKEEALYLHRATRMK